MLRISALKTGVILPLKLGNEPKDAEIVAALQDKLHNPSVLVREHVQWELEKENH
jgi:epoxyqueuosine reductase QueG